MLVRAGENMMHHGVASKAPRRDSKLLLVSPAHRFENTAAYLGVVGSPEAQTAFITVSKAQRDEAEAKGLKRLRVEYLNEGDHIRGEKRAAEIPISEASDSKAAEIFRNILSFVGAAKAKDGSAEISAE